METTEANGWTLHTFYLMKEILQDLQAKVEKLKQRVVAQNLSKQEFLSHPDVVLFRQVLENIRHHVPSNPAHKDFALGNTLGKENRSFRRVKKHLKPRYRIFFRYQSSAPKSIIYIWMNDENTIRKEGDKNDVYATFLKMIKSGTVPRDFKELLSQSKPAAR
ncbi:type II toxin-antitoxin system YhaV family toxin [Oceanospirillum maris]|uniref:type II toxin-antitoxin system YhaV family toxin n=1 Tax=Oceanospirillum maris TaxID=64977 RepID=UPI000405A65F|nr:type II toxin-antitoxin system YhaV family toxin [Oceanospirillum maris]